MHRAGKRHTNADALSRGRWSQCGLVEVEKETLPCDAVSHLMLPAWTEEEIKAQQGSDSDDQLAGDEYPPGQMSVLETIFPIGAEKVGFALHMGGYTRWWGG